MANVIYDTTNRLPHVDSLRRALLTSVWLRRQEMKVREVQVMAMGLAGAVSKDMSGMSKSYQEFVQAAFPFTAGYKEAQDQQLVEMMQKEAVKGPIQFSEVKNPSPLQQAAKKVRVGDDFRNKMHKFAGKVL